MRHYETAFLITPKLEEEETEKLIQKMADVVAKKKGKMINIEKWGKKKLAYPISNLNEAFYVFFHYEGEPGIPSELERRFRQTEPVLRYLTLRKEVQFMPKKKTRVKSKKEEEAPEQADEKEDVGEESEASFDSEELSEEN
ncbi:MAG: 30S ribosomal protein S6 [Candidatus Aminicenantes bacterium]|nr:30S ribosomal protein S6 [Candidatus Aminicenantes bacterium]MDH5385363.1 30S ribosomal protein S6 [Candidatus Aminicenantes bacterium]MDH5742045.1 30S ribosomal protein S6 [Candidatus Aminicenantes bacterium]